MLSELCSFPSQPARERSADRRSGACEAPVRGPVTQARRARSLALASRANRLRSPRAGDARLSALHSGDLLASGPALRSLTFLLVLMRARQCVEDARERATASARSGGGRGSGASRGMCACTTRRTPHPILLKQCLAISTLGGRDVAKIGESGEVSNVLSPECVGYRERELWRAPATRGGADCFRRIAMPKVFSHVGDCDLRQQPPLVQNCDERLRRSRYDRRPESASAAGCRKRVGCHRNSTTIEFIRIGQPE